MNSSIEGETRSFCCHGCQSVAEMITEGGLEAYYRLRDSAPPRPEQQADYSHFDLPSVQKGFVRQQGKQSNAQLLLHGVRCAACVWLIEQVLGRLPGISSCRVNLNEQRASIDFIPEQTPLSEIFASIEQIGYRAEPYRFDLLLEQRHQEQRQMLRRLGVAGVGMMQVGMFAVALYAGDFQGISDTQKTFMRWVSWLVTTPVVFYSAMPFFQGAWRGLKNRRPGMDLPVALAIGMAYIASTWATFVQDGEVYFDSVVMFTFLLLAGRFLEMRARHYAGRQATELNSLLPATAERITADGGLERIPIEELRIGDHVVVKPGATLPVDGEILSGTSSISEAALTGEFLPLRKHPGDSVIAGSINEEQPLTIRATALGEQLRLAAIIDLVDQAQQVKPRFQQLADRISRHFVMGVLLLSTCAGMFWWQYQPEHALWVVLAMLVVSCPCALSLATPTAVATITHTMRRHGLLVTRGTSWEALLHITQVVFDKTGTLTQGALRIRRHHAPSNAPILALAAALERSSEHPIAKAFHEYDEGLQAESVQIYPGHGLSGRIAGETLFLGHADFVAQHCHLSVTPPDTQGQWLLLANQREVLGWIELEDQLREDAAETIRQLQAMQIQVTLLSGDRSDQVAKLAQELGIDRFIAGATPDDKLAFIERQQQQGQRLLMVGDGINDIPVLAQADVSIAMAGSSDLAKTHADCLLLNTQLSHITTLLRKAHHTQRIIRQNIFWAVGYNTLGISLAAIGWLPPYLAAIGMSLSSLLVILNALRLNR